MSLCSGISFAKLKNGEKQTLDPEPSSLLWKGLLGNLGKQEQRVASTILHCSRDSKLVIKSGYKSRSGVILVVALLPTCLIFPLSLEASSRHSNPCSTPGATHERNPFAT